jgi:1-acyl-sn-glycerol-3-phosphate acyltransferase
LPWLIEMGCDLLLSRPRSFQADCALAVRSLPRPPVVEGIEHIPREGSLILIANHYQRRDLWIGWTGGLLCNVVWHVRPEQACHFIVEDRAVLDGASITWTRPIFARVARVWDLVLVTPAEARDADAAGWRRRALRECLRRLKRADGCPVCLCIMPEGITGGTSGLIRPVSGSGRSLLALAGTGARLLPAAVWEDTSGALHAHFGPAWRPQPPAGLPSDQLDTWAGDDAMRRVAALLPPSFQGVYRERV